MICPSLTVDDLFEKRPIDQMLTADVDTTRVERDAKVRLLVFEYKAIELDIQRPKEIKRERERRIKGRREQGTEERACVSVAESPRNAFLEEGSGEAVNCGEKAAEDQHNGDEKPE